MTRAWLTGGNATTWTNIYVILRRNDEGSAACGRGRVRAMPDPRRSAPLAPDEHGPGARPGRLARNASSGELELTRRRRADCAAAIWRYRPALRRPGANV